MNNDILRYHDKPTANPRRFTAIIDTFPVDGTIVLQRAGEYWRATFTIGDTIESHLLDPTMTQARRRICRRLRAFVENN